MPVVGLPTAVETVINSLLQSNGIKSYKIAGNPDVTTIVLRFGVMVGRGTTSPIVQNSFEKGSAHSPHPAQGAWNRKSPSHVIRDQKRHEAFLSSKFVTTPLSSSPTVTSISPRPSREYTLRPTVNDPVTINTVSYIFPFKKDTLLTRNRSLPCVNSDTEISTQFENNNNNKPQTADHVNNTSQIDSTNDTSCTASLFGDSGFVPEPELSEPEVPDQLIVQQEKQQQLQQQQQDEEQPATYDSEQKIFKTLEITCRDKLPSFETFTDIYDSDNFRSYVFDLKSEIKNKLLDQNRNQKFKKIVMDNFMGKKSLIVETDDLIVECDLERFQLHRWFVKEAASCPYELMRLRHLKFFDPVHPDDMVNEVTLAAACVTYTLRLIKKVLKAT